MPTSGPIVRTGATPEFWRNWENIFGSKKKSTSAKPAKKKAAAVKSSKASGAKKAKAKGKKK